MTSRMFGFRLNDKNPDEAKAINRLDAWYAVTGEWKPVLLRMILAYYDPGDPPIEVSDDLADQIVARLLPHLHGLRVDGDAPMETGGNLTSEFLGNAHENIGDRFDPTVGLREGAGEPAHNGAH